MIYFIISLIVWFIFLSIKLKAGLHMLQQNLYNGNNRYIKWTFKNYKKVFLNIDLLLLIYTIFLLLVDNIILSSILFNIILVACILKYYEEMKNDKLKEKKPLVVTSRIKRLIITLGIIILIPIVSMFINYNDIYLNSNYIKLTVLSYLSYYLLLLVNVINKPVEKYVYYSFKRKALKKLHSMNNLDVVGITGSYGKTSSKNIVSDILNIKLNALPTPRNLNTPYGLIMTINNHLTKFDDIMIAEMGAYKIGEIKELCDLVKPKYGILTKIGVAHLETFGSEENIVKAKFELIEELPQDGVAILNKDDDKQVKYKIKNKCKKIWIGIDKKCDYQAKNIKMNNLGSTFEVEINKKNIKFETKLLGMANIYNILSGIALGIHFGLSTEELQRAVKGVKQVEHRLELKPNGNITYIDDAYNSNPVGSKMAVEVLGMMPGTKVIVTPGMIELGEKQYEYNKLFGEYIADVCDYTILVGEKQTKPIYDGLMSKKYDKNKIYIINDVKEAFVIVNKMKKKQIYVLLENDLPDLFNE